MSLKGHQIFPSLMASLNSWEYLCSQYHRICPPLYLQLALHNFFLCYFSRHEQEMTKLHHLLKNKEEETREQELQLRVRIFLSALFSLFYTFWTIVHQWASDILLLQLSWHTYTSVACLLTSCFKLFCLREIWGLVHVVPKNGSCTQFYHVHLHKLLLFMRLQTQNLK